MVETVALGSREIFVRTLKLTVDLRIANAAHSRCEVLVGK